jgi:hypothetical protein
VIELILFIVAAVLLGVVAAGVAQPHAIRLVSGALCLVVIAAWLLPFLTGAHHV